jgi:DNA-directed RNA polymerase subunit beta'
MKKQLTELLWERLGGKGRPKPSHIVPMLETDADRETLCAGRVIKPETINYRSLRPEKGGLFDEEIFGELAVDNVGGEVRDVYGAALQRAINERPKGEQQATPEPRSSRFGSLQLAAPVLHRWLRDSAQLAELCALTAEQLDQLLCSELMLVDGDPPQLIERDLAAEPPAEALYSGTALRRWIEFRGHDASALFLSTVAVLPPELRPLAPLDDGGFVTSDLNDLYRRLINRSLRASRLVELNAPPIIVHNEMRMLQEAADALLDNASVKKPVIGPQKRQLVSLTDMLAVGAETHGSWEAIEQLDGIVADEGIEALDGPLPAWLFRFVRYLRALGIKLDVPAGLAPVPLV